MKLKPPKCSPAFLRVGIGVSALGVAGALADVFVSGDRAAPYVAAAGAASLIGYNVLLRRNHGKGHSGHVNAAQ